MVDWLQFKTQFTFLHCTVKSRHSVDLTVSGIIVCTVRLNFAMGCNYSVSSVQYQCFSVFTLPITTHFRLSDDIVGKTIDVRIFGEESYT